MVEMGMFLYCSPCKWAPIFLFPHFGFSVFSWHTAEMSSNEQLEPSAFLSFVIDTALFFTPRRMPLSSQGGKLSAMGKIETASSDYNSRQPSSNNNRATRRKAKTQLQISTIKTANGCFPSGRCSKKVHKQIQGWRTLHVVSHISANWAIVEA